ncbi:S-adenosylmethionine:tRNA ribosyltransferase-isomerase [Flavisolibacter nicotianae]|uniref:S-adenosylmethionine:tRNA ribosyltransferase-isomerase n=1 Tax=Flavisolibacter nicotianae TaxID=2364882 RepID=UPI000EB1CCA6|nr:S-adenosylmethionine:tRNA ribosyltransferase-isomerase [Flavisolibacter nicotianae]
MKKEEILIQNYTYTLPNERIAHRPLQKRDNSKLLVYKSGKIEEDRFSNLPERLPEGATLILNNTRVIEARIFFTKPTGGVIEIFCLEPHGQSMEISLQQQGSAEWQCMIGGASKWKPGQVLRKEMEIGGKPVTLEAHYNGKIEDAFIIRFSWAPADLHFVQVLHAAGDIPLPPYIKRSAEPIDKERYQTVFAREEGSVAVPTAALHFTEETFESLRRKNIHVNEVTLNVGAGTFKPVKTESIADHHMHSETFTVKRDSLRAILEATTVIAVGTTSLRTIESLHWMGVKLLKGDFDEEWSLEQWEVYDLDPSIPYQESIGAILQWMEEKSIEELHCRTALLIVPGYRFQIPSAIITNFHQPGSTLLLLVAAFIGENWRKVYQYAMEHDFRFLSYGDSSLLWRE